MQLTKVMTIKNVFAFLKENAKATIQITVVLVLTAVAIIWSASHGPSKQNEALNIIGNADAVANLSRSDFGDIQAITSYEEVINAKLAEEARQKMQEEIDKQLAEAEAIRQAEAEAKRVAEEETNRAIEAKKAADAKALAAAKAKAAANPSQDGYCFVFPAYIRPHLATGSMPDDATVNGHKHVCNKLDDGGKDKPSKSASDVNKKGHDAGACYDWDERPNIKACYPVSVYGKLLNNFLKNNPPESVAKHGLKFKKP